MPRLDRTDLVAALRAEFMASEHGPGRMVLVTGEAGAGKTSLVRNALPDAAWGYCEPLTTPRPLGPFRDLALRLGPNGLGGRNALDVADRLLRRLGRPAPPVVVEDAHWIDTSSAEVLRYLGRRIEAASALVVVIARDDLQVDGVLAGTLGDLGEVVGRIHVPALNRSEIEQLTATSGVDPDEVMRLTWGNALLVDQLLAAPAGPVSASLRESLAARLARLTPAARKLVRLLSVVAGRIPLVLVDGEGPALDELVAAGVLSANADELEFRHELVRRTIEETLPPGQRRGCHKEILLRLNRDAGTEPARLAHHSRGAGRTDLALPAEIAAAERAGGLGSHREAAAHYRRAVTDAARTAPRSEQARLLLLLAEEEWAIARTDDARAAASKAFALSATIDDPLLRSRAARVLSRFEPTEEEGHRLARTAVELSEPHGPTVELAAARANLAIERMVARDLEEAVVQAQRAIELSRQVGDARSEAHAGNALGSAQLLVGDADGQIALRRAIHLAAANGLDLTVGNAYGNLVSASGEARLYQLSAAASREAFSYFTARDLDGMAKYTRAWTARCLFEQGRWDEADAELAQLEGMEGEVSPIAGLIVHYLTGRLQNRRGDRAASAALDRAEAIANVTGSLQRIAPVAAARAEESWLAGRDTDVVSLRKTYELALARQNPWTIGELGFWLWRSGERLTLPDSAAEPFRRHVAGDLGGAAELWEELGCPYEVADALADSPAEADLRKALDIFTGLGAAPARRRTLQRLRAIGVRSLPRGPRTATAANTFGLTAREAEILPALVSGRTDQEIARTLHLSVRTVEHHVAAILRKTGAPTRRELR